MTMRSIESREGLGSFVNDPDPEKASLARLMVEGSRVWTLRYPDIPLPSAVTPEAPKVSELSLRQQWNRQAENLARLFAQELGQTEEQYIEGLPKFNPQPKGSKGRFDIPVVVETRVPLKRMLELAGIVPYLDVDSSGDWRESGFRTPNAPYSVWLNDGSPNLGQSVRTVRNSLKAGERGATIYEGIALYLRYPRILENHSLALPGSQVAPHDSAPFLSRGRDGKTILGSFLVGYESRNDGSVVVGKTKN